VHQRVRLGILTIANEYARWSFDSARDMGLTAVTLQHIRVLEEAGLIDVQKGTRSSASNLVSSQGWQVALRQEIGPEGVSQSRRRFEGLRHSSYQLGEDVDTNVFRFQLE